MKRLIFFFLRIIGENCFVVKVLLVKWMVSKKHDPIYSSYEHNLNLFLGKENKEDKQYIRCLYYDVYFWYFFEKTKPEEYFIFKFENKSTKERHTYLTDIEKDEICGKVSSVHDFYLYLKDKYGAYELFHDFFKRDVIKVESKDDFDIFCEFIAHHNKFVLKQSNGSRGSGVWLINRSDLDSDISIWFNNLISQNDSFIVEELVSQTKEMAIWHPESVNTIRCSGVLTKDGYTVFKPFFRVGRGDSFVDNASQGGILANINSETGVIETDGYDESGNVYKEHPDTNLSFKGYVIPRWNELVKIAQDAALLLKSNPYISWDFALTEKGWIIIEGNRGQLLSQIAGEKGLKKDFLNLMNQASS